MGAIERIAAIWKANLNEALDRIEDPAKMVDQIVRDAEHAVDQAVATLVKARATKRRLERDVERNAEQMQMWQAKAAAAVEAGNDEGARLALDAEDGVGPSACAAGTGSRRERRYRGPARGAGRDSAPKVARYPCAAGQTDRPLLR